MPDVLTRGHNFDVLLRARGVGELRRGKVEILQIFRHLVERIKTLTPARHLIDRCNLTIFYEPGHECLPERL